MNNNLKITCPKCKATFDAGDAFNAHFENAQIENEKKLKEAAQLEIALERLTVEQRAQATPLRVARLARDQLQMRNPAPGITQYVTRPGLAREASQ